MKNNNNLSQALTSYTISSAGGRRATTSAQTPVAPPPQAEVLKLFKSKTGPKIEQSSQRIRIIFDCGGFTVVEQAWLNGLILQSTAGLILLLVNAESVGEWSAHLSQCSGIPYGSPFRSA